MRENLVVIIHDLAKASPLVLFRQVKNRQVKSNGRIILFWKKIIPELAKEYWKRQNMRGLFDAIALLLHSLEITTCIRISRNDQDRDPLLDGQTGRERESQQREGEREGERAG